jgi:hypothetical protein
LGRLSVNKRLSVWCEGELEGVSSIEEVDSLSPKGEEYEGERQLVDDDGEVEVGELDPQDDSTANGDAIEEDESMEALRPRRVVLRPLEDLGM